MLEQIKQVICEFADVEPEEITVDSVLRLDLALNSLDLINIAVKLEGIFGVQIPDKRITSFRTVGDMMEYIESQKNEA